MCESTNDTRKSENVQWGERMATYVGLMRWNGYSVQEIAENLNISRQQVYLHLQKIPFPNEKARRYPRPALNEEQVRAVISYFATNKDSTVTAAAESTGIPLSDVTMLCNNIRGAHSWYFSEGYPLVADYLNKEGVTLDYLEQLAGVQGLAQYVFSTYPYKEMPQSRAKAVAAVIDVPVEKMMAVAFASCNMANGMATPEEMALVIGSVTGREANTRLFYRGRRIAPSRSRIGGDA